ncbi:MAG: choice-of-anchor V domain-containing protein [Saprospiraceae bacterium]
MNKLYTFAVIISVMFCLYSFSINPHDGYTGAPGDHFCIECHVQTNVTQGGTLTVEGFPAVITPNEVYALQIINHDTVGTAVRSGFQMTILGPFNTRAGDLSNPSPSSIVSITNNREYWDHNPAKEFADTNVVSWSVQWQAPDLQPGSVITYYAVANFADGNFSNVGDRIVAENGTGTIMLSGTEEINSDKPIIFPNPGSNLINFRFRDKLPSDGVVSFFNMVGHMVEQSKMDEGQATIPQTLPSGVYLLQINTDQQTSFVRWTKI